MNRISMIWGSFGIPVFRRRILALLVYVFACWAINSYLALPVQAHHPFGGATPATGWEGFLSGLGHPVIGLDHLAFVIATGLLAVAVKGGLGIPVGFVVASAVGTGLHLMGFTIPAAEVIIAGSVVLFGLFLALKNRPPVTILLLLSVLAGLLHGYAYGEVVIGAEMTPIVAYLLGFMAIQLTIAGAIYQAIKLLKADPETSALNLRFAGFVLVGLGSALVSGVLAG
ncbi:MAG: HupE/UreJ family protein [Cyanophyceae cyanobacterium]